MATYVWTGNAQADNGLSATNLNGAENVLDFTRFHIGNFWNEPTNWLLRESNSGTGGGGSGGDVPGEYFYSVPSTYPKTGDDAIFQGLEKSPIDGISAHYPVHECLFGGISGSAAGAGWGDDGATAGRLKSLTVLKTYFHGWEEGRWYMAGHSDLYTRSTDGWAEPPSENGSRARFGKFLGGQNAPNRTGVAQYYIGLNIAADTAAIDSRSMYFNDWSIQTLIHLYGKSVDFGTLYHVGGGVIKLYMKQIDNLILHGTAPDGNNGTNFSPRYWINGKIGQYLRLECEDLRQFDMHSTGWHGADYNPDIPHMVVANRQCCYNHRPLGAQPGVNINGNVTKLDLYPSWSAYHPGTPVDPTGYRQVRETYGSIVRLKKYWQGNPSTWGPGYVSQLNMFEYNPFYSIPLQTVADDATHQVGPTGGLMNSQLEIEGGASGPVGGDGTPLYRIDNCDIEAGYVTAYNLSGKLVFVDGTLQSDSILDFRWIPSDAEVEIAGTSAGSFGGQGLFCNSLQSHVYFPAGVDVSFRKPTDGTTASMTGGIGLFALAPPTGK